MHRLNILLVMFVWLNFCTGYSYRDDKNNMVIYQLDIYNRKHHKGDQFRNPYPAIPRPFLKSFLWLVKKIISGEEKGKIFPADSRVIPLQEIQKKHKSYRLWWFGHSTVYIQGPEFSLITDPHFSNRASPFDFVGPIRHPPLPISIENIPDIDFVLISHNHYDHLDFNSVIKIDKKFRPLFLVPLKLGTTLKKWGIKNVVELDWWQYIKIQNLNIYCTPARHFSSRTLWDRNQTLWSGWFVKDTYHHFSFYFAGDTGYERFFQEIQKEIGKPQVAILPIGAFEPRWFMKEVHIDPEEAIQAFIDLQAKELLPIHWGTFYLAEEPMNLPVQKLKQESRIRKQYLKNRKIHNLKIGEYIEIPL